ncbi:MAG: hypothetical protein H7Z75_19560, partial [Ferruginibacter sp.]|nr:hypothetical protein [Cytophagales bacterium]
MFQHLVPKRLPLSAFERKISPINGVMDEGLIEEIIIRIVKPATRFCIEFGAGNGKDNSHVRNLIVNHGFSALLIEADSRLATQLKTNYQGDSRVQTAEAFIYAETIESLFAAHGVPAEPDFLIIDIDGNDYHVWKSLVN